MSETRTGCHLPVEQPGYEAMHEPLRLLSGCDIHSFVTVSLLESESSFPPLRL
jgi:hypothetical protein